jgi:NAD(P)-dependent dehydrogenase (short-subunit alcohol dehydrogenase family)
LGRAISARLARDGYAVAVNYCRSSEAADALVAELERAGCRVEAVRADITDPEEAERLVARAEDSLGPIDLLVNNAAVFERRGFLDLDEEDWSRHLRLNLDAPYRLMRRVGAAMWERGRGRIVNICGTVGIQPPGDYAPYCVSKAGLDVLTRCAAEALAPRVQVNGVAPGAILFPEGTSEQERREVLSRVPAGRTGEPADVAAAVAFFAAAPDYVTGTILPVDGGASLVTG